MTVTTTVNDAAKTLRAGGKVAVGDLGYLTATKKSRTIYELHEDGSGSYRVASARYVVQFQPSGELRSALI